MKVSGLFLILIYVYRPTSKTILAHTHHNSSLGEERL